MYNKKIPITNFRPITVFAISMLLGIGLNYSFDKIILFVCVSIFLLCYVIKTIKNERKNPNEINRGKNTERLIAIIKVVLLGVIIGLIISSIQIGWYNDLYDLAKINKVSGRIKEIQIKNGLLLIEKLYFNDTKVTGRLIIKNLKNLESGNFQIGDVITFNGNIINSSLFNGRNTLNSYNLINKVKYETAGVEIVSQIKGNLKFGEHLKTFYREMLKATMDENSFYLSNALMFGGTFDIDSQVTKAFMTTCIGHVFSVSGLHVGVIYLFFNKVITKLKGNGIIKIVIIIPFMTYYAFICGLRPPIIRSLIMFTVILLADTLYYHNDKINTISLSAIACMLYSPLSLYTAGGVLSFVTVLSMLVLPKVVAEILPKKLKALSTLISAQIGTIPVTSYYFGYIPVFALLLNLVVVPIISFSFIYILVATPITYVTGVNFLRLIDIVILLITKGLIYVSNLNFVIIEKSMRKIAVIIYYIICYIASDYVFIDKSKKRKIILPLGVLLGLSLI